MEEASNPDQKRATGTTATVRRTYLPESTYRLALHVGCPGCKRQASMA